VKTKPISEETRSAILETTWTLIARKGRLDVSPQEIAEISGVSRQTIYLAFGNRAGLLTAMARHKDTQSDHVERLSKISHAAELQREDFEAYVGVWLDYLPLIYPVAILLDAAALTDREAASALDDRMKGALLAGLKSILRRLAKSGHVSDAWKPERAAELVWSAIQPSAWRQLVVECGWSPKEFRRSRLEIVRAIVA
jgi:AcrR family transcriptional regulator